MLSVHSLYACILTASREGTSALAEEPTFLKRMSRLLPSTLKVLVGPSFFNPFTGQPTAKLSISAADFVLNNFCNLN